MIVDLTPQERRHFRVMCENLRKLLRAENPAGVMAILDDIGNLESEALFAKGDDFRLVRQSLNELLQNLMGQGIINPQNWAKLFGEPG